MTKIAEPDEHPRAEHDLQHLEQRVDAGEGQRPKHHHALLQHQLRGGVGHHREKDERQVFHVSQQP